MSWIDIESALIDAVVLASGYPTSRVIWSYQNVTEPNLDFIVVHFGGEAVVGIDRVHTSTDLTRPAGSEIETEIRGVREVPLTISVYTSDRVGDLAARRVAEKVRTKLRLPSIRYSLRDVGLSLFDPGPVQYIPDITASNFRGRAMCTIRCYVPVMDCLEYCGYIARVKGTWIAYGAGASWASGFTGAFDSASATTQSIVITPASFNSPIGRAQQLTATLMLGDGSAKDVTSSCDWSSSDTAIATVSGGIVVGVAVGSASITASIGSTSGTSTATVLLTYTTTVTADAPYFWWRFNETSGATITDTMGHINGTEQSPANTLYRQSPLTTETGQYSQGAVDNSSSAIVSDAMSQSLSAWSIEWWTIVQPLATGENGLIFTFNNGNNLELFCKDATGAAAIQINFGSQTNSSAGVFSATNAAHYVFTYDGATLRLYKNGNSTPVMTRAVVLSGSTIASIVWSGTGNFGGAVDEIAFYNSVLSTARMLAHYQAGAA